MISFRKMSFFIRFKTQLTTDKLPPLFTYPFNYTPHPIAVKAAEELQNYIKSKIEAIHNFGMNGEADGIGKMFGVLVVKNEENELGYISAFSGKLGKKNDYEQFVPPVYDMLQSQGFYKEEEEKINILSREILNEEEDNRYQTLKTDFIRSSAQSEREIADVKAKKKNAKLLRTVERKLIENSEVSNEEKEILYKQLDRDSANLHYELKHLTTNWREKLNALKIEIESIEAKITAMKQRRKQMSINLQHRLFDHYIFLNAKGETKALHQIFPMSSGELPPSGAGECAAPKLLHYAFQHQLKPIALAEFWYGKSPASEVRKHGYFYPACRSKCLPILNFMLQGLDVEPNPLAENPSKVLGIDVVYNDEHVIVVNKPHDFLSVPGKSIEDSAFTRVKNHCEDAQNLMVVHRLDMSTSGLLIFAKSKFVHKHLQLQFLHKTIRKQYAAILDGELEQESGRIDLPLRVDLENRPRQLVCFEHGKPATTKYKIIERKNGKTLVHFFPISGRTHQLRVHAAHNLGLNIPILGDDLYGKRSNRLYLHAEAIQFIHPITNKEMQFKAEAGFGL